MKIKVLSLTEFDNVLKGIVKLVPGCCMEINGLGAEIKIGANGKIRAFIKTTCIKTDDGSETEICLENVGKLINALAFLKDLNTPEQFNLESWKNQFNIIKDLNIGDTIDADTWATLDENMK